MEQKQLEAERAKTQIEATRAAIRALTAEVEAEQAELKVVLEELEAAMTEAERAALNSDIALIIADITTRCLAGIRLGVEQAEIAEAHRHIQQHLADTLRLLELRTLQQELLRDSEAALQAEVWQYLAGQKAHSEPAWPGGRWASPSCPLRPPRLWARTSWAAGRSSRPWNRFCRSLKRRRSPGP